MQQLPIDASLPDLLTHLRTHNSLVLTAPPGAGKTTRIPPAIVAANLLPNDHPHLIMLQPRRVAARAAAQRIAEEQRWQLGDQVGYHIRFEKRYRANTRIRILTEAILTRMLLADQSLEDGGGIGCVILDEFHERSIHSDLALAFLRDIQQTIRPDLKILVMSATLDAQPISAFLGNCPILESQGRTFPIDITYRPPLPARNNPLEEHIAGIVEELLNPQSASFSIQNSAFNIPNDILIFLPGKAEIDRATRTLTQSSALSPQSFAILPLHGSLSSEDQQRALAPAPRGRRKIILATNIAETSLTIDGVRTVIDSGLARIASFDPDRGMDRLDLSRISKASAAQHTGRAGRQPPPPPARAIRLWPESEQKHLPDFTPPEIHRIDLAGTLLAVHAWLGEGGHDPRSFPWFDPPTEEMLSAAEDLLTLLGAIRNAGVPPASELTDLGRAMQQIPAHPRIARLLLAAINTPFLEDALTLATLLSDDSRARRFTDPLSVLHRPPAHLDRLRSQFAAIARSLPLQSAGPKPKELADLFALAYPDRIARRRTGGNDSYSAIMVGSIGLRLAPETLTPALARSDLFLALDVHHDPNSKKSESLVRAAIPIEESALKRLFPENFHTGTTLEYSPHRKKPVAFIKYYYRDLLLRESQGEVDPAFAGDVLAKALAPQAEFWFRQNAVAAKLLARIAFLRHYMPEHDWPLFDENQLRELLSQAAQGKRTLEELTESAALPDTVRSALPYPLDRLLDQHAPETIQVPSGSNIKLDYALPLNPAAAPPAPVLAVRLQELFGWLETPRIAGGRVPVVLHLLSPGFKPMQITSDLKSFWSSAYFEVRKDLRTRYPKHKWPEDPLTAAPEAKGRRR